MTLATNLYVAVGRVFLVLITLIAVRMFSYWYSFIFHWKRYRRLDPVTTSELHALGVPYVKVQITTKGSPGSTEVILRGIQNIESLVLEDPQFYNGFLSVEVVTESADQSAYLEQALAGSPARVDTLAVPAPLRDPERHQAQGQGPALRGRVPPDGVEPETRQDVYSPLRRGERLHTGRAAQVDQGPGLHDVQRAGRAHLLPAGVQPGQRPLSDHGGK